MLLPILLESLLVLGQEGVPELELVLLVRALFERVPLDSLESLIAGERRLEVHPVLSCVLEPFFSIALLISHGFRHRDVFIERGVLQVSI